jgi:uncharacterized membrane protein YeaQ/YmgE (transglycosylase-associated protein family)
MGIIAWIVVGAIAGFVASRIAGGHQGVIGTIVLGVVGGLVGGFAATEIFHRGSVNGVNLESILIAIAGAVVVLVVWHVLNARSPGRLRL